MKMSTQVQVTGPLAPYAAGYRHQLDEEGYSPWTAVSYLYTLARVSRWLADNGLTAADLDGEHVDCFLSQWRNRFTPGGPGRATPRGMYSLLGYLRGVGAVPVCAPKAPGGPHAVVLDEFVAHLRADRGLAEATIGWYRFASELFLFSQLDSPGEIGALDASQISEFVLAQAERRGAGSLSNVVTAIRALLRFCYLRGYTATSLVGATPGCVGWRELGPARSVGAAQIRKLLDSCDQRTNTGRRDFAIVTVLARLGLRAGEVAALRVDDIDWRAAQIVVRGKGARVDRLPLPTDVGQAIADYCCRGRRQGACRALFLQSHAPYGALTSSTVGKVVQSAGIRAGIPTIGAHQLRHGAAEALRRHGAPLREISQVLRHAHTVTTVGYARDDEDALAQAARCWPGSAS